MDISVEIKDSFLSFAFAVVCCCCWCHYYIRRKYVFVVLSSGVVEQQTRPFQYQKVPTDTKKKWHGHH